MLLPTVLDSIIRLMNKLIVIKLGGSVITDKNSQKPKVRLSIIKRLAKEIGQIYKQGKYRLILVHGAGSFAHPLVKKFNLHLGVSSREQKQALSLTHQQLSQLNNLVLAALTENQIPAVSFPPHAFITQRDGELFKFNCSLIKKALESGLVSVLFGDMVIDETLGFSVISGDTIAPYLAKKLKADLVIFLSDVDGIFDSDPKKNPKAKLIREINNKNYDKILSGITATVREDVTGEMKGKIISLGRNLKGIPVILANGVKPRILQKALMPIPIGTKLLLS